MDEIVNVAGYSSFMSSTREALKEHGSVRVEELAAIVAENALDKFEYEGRTLREWTRLVLSEKLVEVVYCKDCMWRNKVGCPYMYINSVAREDFDFCSDGQRGIGGIDYGV